MHWHNLRIYIAYSNGEIRVWKFQWRHSRIPEVLSKSCSTWYMHNWILYSLAQTAQMYCLKQRRNWSLNISMTSFAHTGSTFEKVVAAWYMQNLVSYSLAQTALTYCQQQRWNETLKIHTGSTFEKLSKPDWCRIKSFIHWRKLRINIAYNSGEIKLWNFYDVICAYRKYFWKKFSSNEMCGIWFCTSCHKLLIDIINSSSVIYI